MWWRVGVQWHAPPYCTASSGLPHARGNHKQRHCGNGITGCRSRKSNPRTGHLGEALHSHSHSPVCSCTRSSTEPPPPASEGVSREHAPARDAARKCSRLGRVGGAGRRGARARPGADLLTVQRILVEACHWHRTRLREQCCHDDAEGRGERHWSTSFTQPKLGRRRSS